MRKKYIIAGITGMLLLTAGVFYSLTRHQDLSAPVMISELSDPPRENGTEEDFPEDKLAGTDSVQESEKGVSGSENDTFSLKSKDGTMPAPEQTGEEEIYVHLCGAVLHPGVYRVKSFSRIVDVIELAGGLLETAAGDYINQAEQMEDGQRIYVPSLEEVGDMPAEEYYSLHNSTAKSVREKGTETKSTASKNADIRETDAYGQLVDINRAGKAELMELPGIGEAKAAGIIEYRNAHGDFQAIEDLMKIPGIKEGLFRKVADYITVR